MNSEHPLDLAMAAHGGGERLFGAHLWLHAQHGHVVSGREAFVMGRPVRRDATEQELADIQYRFHEPDAWYIWMAAGTLAAVLATMPYELPWIGFRRGKRCARVHWIRTVDLRRHVFTPHH